jgi:hypothetical protein
MIISRNRNPALEAFQSLLDEATSRLNDDAKKRMNYYIKRTWSQLENNVKDVLDISSVGTPFEGTIEKIAGQKFPDIVANKYFGVEVKSSKDEKWTTIGGSINESTRIDGVEKIFVTFGKLVNPVEFRSRPYEECLCDVAVTHYPRYRIDMNLQKGNSIFDKMKTTYDDLRLSTDPVAKIVDYYRSTLGEGESLWWTGKPTIDNEIDALPMKIRMLRALPADEKKHLRVMGLVLFPCVTSNSPTKYEQFSVWLATNRGVISTSMRDMFSAGGTGTIKAQGMEFIRVPKVLMHVYENCNEITRILENADESILHDTWKEDIISKDRLGQWIGKVVAVGDFPNHDVGKLLRAIFKK